MNSNRLLALATMISLASAGLATAADQKASEKSQAPAATSAAPAADKAAVGDASQPPSKKNAKKQPTKDVPTKQEDKKG